jgi:hypothetical protein
MRRYLASRQSGRPRTPRAIGSCANHEELASTRPSGGGQIRRRRYRLLGVTGTVGKMVVPTSLSGIWETKLPRVSSSPSSPTHPGHGNRIKPSPQPPPDFPPDVHLLAMTPCDWAYQPQSNCGRLGRIRRASPLYICNLEVLTRWRSRWPAMTPTE